MTDDAAQETNPLTRTWIWFWYNDATRLLLVLFGWHLLLVVPILAMMGIDGSTRNRQRLHKPESHRAGRVPQAIETTAWRPGCVSSKPINLPVAQLEERPNPSRQAAGSIPAGGANHRMRLFVATFVNLLSARFAETFQA